MKYAKAIAVSLVIAVLVAIFLGLSFMLTYTVVSCIGGLFR